MTWAYRICMNHIQLLLIFTFQKNEKDSQQNEIRIFHLTYSPFYFISSKNVALLINGEYMPGVFLRGLRLKKRGIKS